MARRAAMPLLQYLGYGGRFVEAQDSQSISRDGAQRLAARRRVDSVTTGETVGTIAAAAVGLGLLGFSCWMFWWRWSRIVRWFAREWRESKTAADRHTEANLRIADGARRLRRELLTSFEDWPNGPRTLDDLIGWTRKLALGFEDTDSTVRQLGELRTEASLKVWRAVDAACAAYTAAAELIRRRARMTISDVVPLAEEEAQLRRAVAHVRRCITELETAAPTKD